MPMFHEPKLEKLSLRHVIKHQGDVLSAVLEYLAPYTEALLLISSYQVHQQAYMLWRNRDLGCVTHPPFILEKEKRDQGPSQAPRLTAIASEVAKSRWVRGGNYVLKVKTGPKLMSSGRILGLVISCLGRPSRASRTSPQTTFG